MTAKDAEKSTKCAQAICALVDAWPDIHIHADLPLQIDARLLRERVVEVLKTGASGNQPKVTRVEITPGGKWRVSIRPNMQELII